MFCSKCGAQNTDDAKFCHECGMPLRQIQEWQPESEQGTQQQNFEKKKKKTVIAAAIIGAAVLIGAGVGFGSKMYLDHQKQLAQERWEAYVADVDSWQSQMDTQKLDYIFSEQDESDYADLCATIKDSIEQHLDEEVIDGQKKEVETFFEALAVSNQEQIGAKKQELEGVQIDFLLDSDLSTIEDCKAKVSDFLAGKKYADAMQSLKEWEEVISFADVDFDAYTVSVRQYDVSEYPNVKLYVDVSDQNGNFVDGLAANAFFVNEGRSVDGALKRANLSNAAKLNQNEGISIGLVADVSGSMDSYMDETQNAMISFINSVQFDKGDEIEIVEFNDQAYICQSFTSDVYSVIDSIHAMTPGGCTRLYDTLINEIARIQSCDNAKCIIGFTDGMDNESIFTAQDVVDMAVANKIPVFLIGISWDCDESSLRYIAQSTGGIYTNIDNVDSLSDIYSSIYAEQKNVYLLEYMVSAAENFTDRFYSDIYVRTEEKQGGYCEKFSFDSMDFFKTMYNKFLVAGIDCQTKGERNLLDSGLIVTTEEAHNNPDCVAYQSQASIDGGGVGSKNSGTFEVLVNYDVINVVKDGDGYILYGYSNYDISRERNYSKANRVEKEYVENSYYYDDISDDTMFWFEENITNYEKLKMIRDADGKWKFYTRTYEREDGGDAIMINQVYQAIMQYDD